MPFGMKPDPTGRPNIDFNRIYENGIRPAIIAAGMIPIRADEEKTGGIIHKPMFERLLLCEYAIADLTTANANVFYELGVRHTAVPRTTQAIYAKHQPIPFDVGYLRALPYDLGEHNHFGEAEAQALSASLTQRLRDLRQSAVSDVVKDSPIFQLLDAWTPGRLPHEKTDVFRDAQLNEERKAKMQQARSMERKLGLEELKRLESDYVDRDTRDIGVIVDLMLSYCGSRTTRSRATPARSSAPRRCWRRRSCPRSLRCASITAATGSRSCAAEFGCRAASVD
jgi:hypothetical protein